MTNIRSGSDHAHWKGDQASYSAFHMRVRKLRGRPQRCEVCRTTDPAVRYDWANITGRYEDPQDYARLCRFCHKFFDAERRKAAQGCPVYGGILGRELLDHLAAERAS